MSYFDKKPDGFQESYALEAVVNGISVNVSHIKNLEQAKSYADAIYDGVHCTWVQVRQHFLYTTHDKVQRGKWLIQIEYGKMLSKVQADRDRESLERFHAKINQIEEHLKLDIEK